MTINSCPTTKNDSITNSSSTTIPMQLCTLFTLILTPYNFRNHLRTRTIPFPITKFTNLSRGKCLNHISIPNISNTSNITWIMIMFRFEGFMIGRAVRWTGRDSDRFHTIVGSLFLGEFVLSWLSSILQVQWNPQFCSSFQVILLRKFNRFHSLLDICLKEKVLHR